MDLSVNLGSKVNLITITGLALLALLMNWALVGEVIASVFLVIIVSSSSLAEQPALCAA